MLKGIRVSPVTSCPCPAPCHSVILADSDCYRWAFLWRYHTSVWAASRSFSKELLEKNRVLSRSWHGWVSKTRPLIGHDGGRHLSEVPTANTKINPMTLGEECNNKFDAACAIPNNNKKHDSRLRGHCRSKQKFDLDNLIMALGHTEGYPKWWLKHPGTGPLPPIDSSLKLSALNNFLLVVSTLSLIGILGMSSRDYRVI